MRRSTAGLTLVELLVAITVLAIGVLGAMALQTTGLKATRTSETGQRLNAAARSEVAVMRVRLGSEDWRKGGTTGCSGTRVADCLVRVTPCQVAGTALDCSGAVAGEPDAYAVRVTVRENDQAAVLNDVVLHD